MAADEAIAAAVVLDAGPLIHLDEVHGTLGILLRAIRRRQRSAAEVSTILRSISERSTLHVKPSLLESVISQVEEFERED